VHFTTQNYCIRKCLNQKRINCNYFSLKFQQALQDHNYYYSPPPPLSKKNPIIQKLQNIGTDDSRLPLEIRDIPGKNRGVVPTKKLSKGDFAVEYAGELIEHSTAEERENEYAMDVSKGCYMYYFQKNGKHYCIDATVETGRYGRLVNHSRQTPNLMTKVIMNGKSPHLILVAKHDIEPGTELLYDYGDRSKESLAVHPWLAK
jgi:histone-lysine N-methyltransferase SETD8